MRFFHSSDWHLGQSLYGQSREYEHAAFLTWLLDQISLHQPDALLIAGDIFDTVNPPMSAQEQLYRFLADAHTRLPSLQIIMIAGNHDSGGRIELPAPLLKALRTHVVGRVRWLDDALDTSQLLVPITNSANAIQAWCLALPFLRPAEVTAGGQGMSTMAAVEDVYAQLIAAAKTQSQGQPLVLMSHAHMVGGAISEESERSIVIGTAEALSTDLFPADVDYVALGHLHRPQAVGGESRIRYSGSPIPLSFSEENYKHQVLLVELETGQPPKIDALLIPRAVQMLRVSGSLSEVLLKLEALDKTFLSLGEQPFLEVRVYADNAPFPPNLRQQIEEALPKNAVRLVRLRKDQRAVNSTDSSNLTAAPLKEQTPQSLYADVWLDKFGEADESVFADFAALVDEFHSTESIDAVNTLL
jgi:exonuclease SbcD